MIFGVLARRWGRKGKYLLQTSGCVAARASSEAWGGAAW
jgi:hypothetical protein